MNKYFVTSLLLLFLVPVTWSEEVPDFDSMAFINESYNFLKNREPEMTDSEYALYEQVVPMAIDRPQFALTLLESMIADDEPESPAFSYVLANVYYTENRIDQAEQYYRKAVEEYPDFLRAWINLGILYYSDDQFAKAIPCFTKAIHLGNGEAQIRGLLGYCLQMTHNPLAAEAAFVQALVGDPDNPDWIEALLGMYLESEQYSKAELMIKQLIRLDPENAENRHLYASVLLSQNRRIDAMTVLENGANLGILEEDDRYLLADLYAEHQLFPEAYETYKTAMVKYPETGRKRMLRYVRSLIGQGRHEEADGILHEFEPDLMDTEKVEYLITLSTLQIANQKWEGARETLEHVLELDPLNGEALFKLGKVHKQQDQIEFALFYFEQSRNLPEFKFLSSMELANIALADNQYQRGISLLENALDQEAHPELENYLIKIKSLVAQTKDDDPSSIKE